MIVLEVFDPRINDDFTITLEQNCFIVDFQGYPTRSKFLFKEISVYNNSNKTFRNYFCSTPKLFCKTYTFLLNNHHQIPHYYGKTYYKNIFHSLERASIIFCKGEDKKSILEKYLNVPIVNLETRGCPTLRELPTPQLLQRCRFEKHTDNRYCSFKIVQSLVSWLNQQ